MSLSFERAAFWTVVAATAVLLVVQLSSLYVAPVSNSYLWWGDESWLMAEYREQVTTGVFRHPDAYGSSLWIANPFPFTAMWLTSLLYGGLSLLFDATALEVGRTVTAILAVALALLAYLSMRKLGVERLNAACAVVLLISSRTFFLTSHSARYDILTSIAIVVLLYVISRSSSSQGSGEHALKGILLGGSLVISVHVPLLLALPVLYWLWTARVRVRHNLVLVVTAMLTVGMLYLIHNITQPALSGESNLSENLKTIPFLRPLSWSVQSSNLEQKFALLVQLAPQFFVFLIAAGTGLFTAKDKRLIVLYCLPFPGWLLLEPAGPSSYLIYFLPAFAIASAHAIRDINLRRIGAAIVLLISLTFISLGIRDAASAYEVGSQLTTANARAVREALAVAGEAKVIAMNPALGHRERAATTHFVELPDRGARRLDGPGYLLAYNSSILPGFMWEVLPLRQEITSPALVRTGQFLDVGRSYFAPLDPALDTMFLQPVNLNELYTRHIH